MVGPALAAGTDPTAAPFMTGEAAAATYGLAGDAAEDVFQLPLPYPDFLAGAAEPADMAPYAGGGFVEAAASYATNSRELAMTVSSVTFQLAPVLLQLLSWLLVEPLWEVGAEMSSPVNCLLRLSNAPPMASRSPPPSRRVDVCDGCCWVWRDGGDENAVTADCGWVRATAARPAAIAHRRCCCCCWFVMIYLLLLVKIYCGSLWICCGL